ncbi:MAG: WD40 repeat domain-containing protein [Acidimicrobiales bacterium]
MHNDRVWAVAYSPDGLLLASGGDDDRGQVVIGRSADSAPLLLELDSSPGRVYALEFSPNGRLLAAGVDDTVQLWDVESLSPIGAPLRGHNDAIRSLSFSSDSTLLATASPDGTVKIWQTDPQEWARLTCRVVDRNMTLGEWRSVGRGEDYVRHCDAFVAGRDAPADSDVAEYVSPGDFGVPRRVLVVDWTILMVLGAGAAAVGLILRLRRT